MVFSSNVFLFFFLPAVLLCYYISPRRLKNSVLLLFSLLFYAWGEPVYIFLMIFTVLVNYGSGMLIACEQGKGKSGKAALALSIVINLALLGYFKYTGFFIDTVNHLLPSSMSLRALSVVLPVGISFYTFQAMSYTIDVYRRQVEPQKNPLDFGTYVALFPQLIAGPIVRYRDIDTQLSQRRESISQFSSGVAIFIIGLGKKMLLANKAGALWSLVSGEGGTLSAWVGMLAYSMQIYFDFSGYSDMAIGLGRMFGFSFLKNFDYPYISKSVTEFWRRWHISLSFWFREYVYIPLGGNRRGLKRQLLNILIVWALTGLWHGASWNFVLWGLYYAIWLAAEKLFLLRLSRRIPGIVRQLLVFLVAAFGWMLFYFTDMAQLVDFIGRMFSLHAETAQGLRLIWAYMPLLVLCCLGATPLPGKLAGRLGGEKLRNVLLCLWLALVFLLCVAALASQSYNPFIYFRF